MEHAYFYVQLKTLIVMLKDELTSNVAGIILHHVKETKGRLTEISDLCGINRKEFNRRGLAKMKSYRQFDAMWQEILDEIRKFSDDYDYTLLDE